MANIQPLASWRRWIARVGVLGLIAAVQSPAFIVNAVAKTLRPGESVKDIAYASGERRKLDVYAPSAPGPAPVVVFFYGGSWQSGSKELYFFLASILASRGYVVVVPDYRVYPEVRFPDFLRDAAMAVHWTRENIAAYGGDPGHLFVMGHSAGAHIAAMLTLDSRWLGEVGLRPQRDLSGLIGISGPYDFLPIKDETLKVVFGGDKRPDTQPITFATSSKPPALFLSGDEDDVVDPGNSQRLAAKLRAAGNVANAVVYQGRGHISVLLGFAPLVSRWFPILRDVEAFIDRTPSRVGTAAVREKAAPP